MACDIEEPDHEIPSDHLQVPLEVDQSLPQSSMNLMGHFPSPSDAQQQQLLAQFNAMLQQSNVQHEQKIQHVIHENTRSDDREYGWRQYQSSRAS